MGIGEYLGSCEGVPPFSITKSLPKLHALSGIDQVSDFLNKQRAAIDWPIRNPTSINHNILKVHKHPKNQSFLLVNRDSELVKRLLILSKSNMPTSIDVANSLLLPSFLSSLTPFLPR